MSQKNRMSVLKVTFSLGQLSSFTKTVTETKRYWYTELNKQAEAGIETRLFIEKHK